MEPHHKQEWHANQYNQHASFVSRLGSPVLTLLNPQAGEAILDLGCGDGTLAHQMATLGALVTGVDSSESMVAAAREKGISAFAMSGDALTFSSQFDAVFSNAALHWMTDYKSVLRGIYTSLKSPGRFVGEFGGEGNIGAILDAMTAVFIINRDFGSFKSPWYFPSVKEYSAALTEAGFTIESIDLINRPTPLGTGLREWLKVFANFATAHLTQEQHERFLDQVEAIVKPRLYSDELGWMADYKRLRFVATKA
jgi:trans-aconitate methyltransferase